MSVRVRYFAGARAAAGVSEEVVPGDASLDELLRELVGRHGPGLGKVIDVATFLVDGVAQHDRLATLPNDVTVDILPPFAGG